MLPPLPTEQLAIDAITSAEFQKAIVASPGRGQVGWHLADLCPTGCVTNWFLDSHRASRAIQATAIANVEVVCSADLPESPVQWAVMPILPRGEAELTREILQQMHIRLEIGGTLVASVNAPRDTWVAEQMRCLFDNVASTASATGCVYRSIKRTPLGRIRSFDAEVVFRDQHRLLKLLTRPGVFAHRRLDVAARHLIENASIEPGDSILDLGCGSGGVGIAVALRTGGRVVAVDSNARAIQCVMAGAAANGLEGLIATLNHDGDFPTGPRIFPTGPRIDASPLDVALLNPPYYGDFAIAEHFVNVARQKIRPGGRLLLVTKSPESYLEHPWAGLRWSEPRPAKNYWLVEFEVIE